MVGCLELAPPSDALVLDEDRRFVVWERTSEAAPKPAAGGAAEAECLLFAGYLARPGGAREGRAAGDEAVAAYLREGPAFGRCLPGAWCAVLWDARRGLLIAAGDAGALRPLYLRVGADRVALAPSLERLLALGPRPGVDEESLVHGLVGVAPPAGRTFWAGIGCLRPGTSWTFDRAGQGEVVWWSAGPRPSAPGSARDSAHELRELLGAVVPQHLDRRPFGITLSSGMDSSSVAALAVQAAGRRPVGVCWTSPEIPEADESAGSGEVLRRLDLEAEWVRADLRWPLRDGLELAPPASGFFATSYPGLWRETCRAAARRGLPVLLTGNSGDHLFGCGIAPYADQLLTGRWWSLASQLVAHHGASPMGSGRLLKHFVAAPILRTYLPAWRNRTGRPQEWLTERAREAIGRRTHPRHRGLLPARHGRARLVGDDGVNHSLRQLGELARREGVALRHPLLDVRILELALRLPPEHVFESGRDKVVLRRAMEGWLPESTLTRHRRIVPTAIAHRGYRHRETATMWRLLTDMRCHQLGLVDEPLLRRAYLRYLDGDDRQVRVWWAASTEAWLRQHL